jgi:hypothetical protein
MKATLEFEVKIPPDKTVTGICGCCRKELETKKWYSYGYVPRLKVLMRQKFKACPYCATLFDHVKDCATPKWVKIATNEYKAVARDGDFLVWKDGCMWKSRYRKKGAKEPSWLERDFVLECAKNRCEKSKNWVV